MSIPVRRSIIAWDVSGSRSSGSGWANRARHRASFRARPRSAGEGDAAGVRLTGAATLAPTPSEELPRHAKMCYM